jgi:hypothetical protein
MRASAGARWVPARIWVRASAIASSAAARVGNRRRTIRSLMRYVISYDVPRLWMSFRGLDIAGSGSRPVVTSV